jgi:hypothetical protein
MSAYYEDEIHNAIYARAAAWDFPLVTYDKTTKLRTTGPGTTKAKAVLIQPSDAAFDLAEKNRRKELRERTDWLWVLDLHFSRRVNTESFEDDLADNPIVIARDGERDRQVRIEIGDVSFAVPPLGEPASGSRARVRLVAALSPK